MKFFKIFTIFFAYGFCLTSVAKLQVKQNSDEQIETQKKLIEAVDNLASALAKDIRYSLTMILTTYMFSILAVRDYFTWTNLAFVFAFLFFNGMFASILNWTITDLAKNKDEDNQN